MHTSHPTVSIVTPVYNGASTLEECYKCVCSQSFPDFEWIIVDDCSTDSSVQLVESWRYERIRLLRREKNAGYPALPRKEACERARGNFIALLDQDDTWVANKLLFQTDYLRRHPEVALLGGNQIVVGPKMHKRTNNRIFKRPSFSPSATDVYSKNPFLASTAIFRRDVYEEVGGFDTNPILNGRDEWELWVRIALAHSTRYEQEVMGQYRWHETNLSHQISAFEGTDHVRNKLGPRFAQPVQDAVVARDHYQKAKNALSAGDTETFKLEIQAAAKLQRKYHIKGLFEWTKFRIKRGK